MRALLIAALALPISAHAATITNDTSGAIITRPAGGYLRHDWKYMPGTSGIHYGLFDSYAIVSNETGVLVGWVSDPAFLEVHVEAAAEPGFYVKLEPGVPLEEEKVRTFGMRYVARAQANTNLRTGRWWIYGRTTAIARFRDFVEDDEFRAIEIEDEWSIEQATALIYRVNASESPGFWVYGEHTVGGVDRIGTIPHRLSAGIITEHWLRKGFSMNLDLFWSLQERGGGRGPGAIFAWWWRW